MPPVEPLTLIGVTQNIAERKQFEAAVERGREQLQLVSDNVPALISYVDTERRYRWLQPRVYPMVQYAGVGRHRPHHAGSGGRGGVADHWPAR